MYFVSKFAQKIEKDGYICRFNSLKNEPVFYKNELDAKLEECLFDTECRSYGEEIDFLI